jgi:hypothetical protein
MLPQAGLHPLPETQNLLSYVIRHTVSDNSVDICEGHVTDRHECTVGLRAKLPKDQKELKHSTIRLN